MNRILPCLRWGLVWGLSIACCPTMSRGEGFDVNAVSVEKAEVASGTWGQTSSDPMFSGYRLSWTLKFHPPIQAPLEVRIWTRLISEWPGNNRQVVEVLKDGKQQSCRYIGGEPIPIKVWGAVYSPSRSGDLPHQCYFYVQCKNRGRGADSIHVYRVEKDFSVSEQGVVGLPEELDKAEQEVQKRVEEYQKREKERLKDAR
ncbi:MAG: hypothetical protein ACFUZC_14045 [Chthoniobacteraceae bacterium]